MGTTSAKMPIFGTIIIGNCLIAAFLAFGIANPESNVFVKNNEGKYDISNWATLVASIIASGVIAVAIWIYSITSHNKTDQVLQKKKTYGLTRIRLLLQLAKEEIEDKDYDSSNQTFDQVIQTLNILSESIDADESKEILELAEIGKLFCKYKGQMIVHSTRTLPFTTSVPANLAALFSMFDGVINKISKTK